MSILKSIKEYLFETPMEVPLPEIYKVLAYHLIKEDYVISKCRRILFFDQHSVSIVAKEKHNITLIVYPNNMNMEDETPTPINFNPSKMAEYDKAFWAGIQLKLITILIPVG